MKKQAFKSALFIIPVTLTVVLLSTHLWIAGYLIAPPPYSGFVFQLESSAVILLIVFYSFILPNRFEIELGLVNGYNTLKLATAKALPVFVYSLTTILIAVLLFQYKPFGIPGTKSAIEVYVPANFRPYILLSTFVTLLFFSSIYFFARVLFRNCYIPIIPDLLIVTFFCNLNDGIRRGIYNIKMCLIDPFISDYFVGNTIPNAYAQKNTELSILNNAWTVNRIVFISISLVLLAATVFLLRRERLHRDLWE